MIASNDKEIMMKSLISLLLLLLVSGCNNSDELQRVYAEMFSIKTELINANNRLDTADREVRELSARIYSLEQEKRDLQSKHEACIEDLARKKNELALEIGKYDELVAKLREKSNATKQAKQEEMKRREELLKQAAESNRSSSLAGSENGN